MADGSVKIDITADNSDVKEKIDETEKGFEELGDSQKETQKETEKTTTKFKELADAIDKQEKELKDLRGEYIEAAVNFGENSAEAQKLKERFSELNSELQENKAKIKSAADSLEDLGDSAKSGGDGFGVADVAIGSFVGDALTGLKDNIIETIGNISALADETREYREDMAKLDTAFTTAGHSTETAQKAYDDFYKILGESDRSVEAVNHLAELTKNEEELSQWSTICAGVTAKFGDSLPIEGLTEAANETAKVGKVTGPLADALNWAGISEDAFNEKLKACNSEQERASLITSTLNGEYAAAADEYNKLTANTQAARDATNNMEQAQAALGAAIEPVTTALTDMKANALQWFVDTGLPALQTGWQWVLDNIPAISVVVAGLTAAWLAFGGAQTIATAATNIMKAAQIALSVVMKANSIGFVILAITALVAGFMILWNNCEGFRNFWIGLWEGIKTAAAAVADWFKNAWTATIEWLKGAVAKITDFFSAAWDGIKNVFSNSIVGDYFRAIWETIKGVFSVVKSILSGNWADAWAAIKNICGAWAEYFKAIWEKIKAVFSVVGSWFGEKFAAAWNGIKNGWSAAKGFFSGIWDGIKSVFSSVKTWFSEKFTAAKDAIINVFSNIGSKFLSIGTDVVNGIWKGISDGLSWIKSKIKGWVGNVVDFCKSILGIKSPSRVFRDEVGKMISLGMAVGIDEERGAVIGAAENVIGSLQGYVDKAKKENDKTVKDYRNEYKAEQKRHSDELASLNKASAEELTEIDKKYNEDKANKNAELLKLDTDYTEKVAELDKKYNEDKQKKNTELLKLDEKYEEDKANKNGELLKLDEDYTEDIAELDEKLVEDKQKKNEELKKLDEKRLKDHAEVYKKSGKQVEDARQKHNENLTKIDENIHKTIVGKMDELSQLGVKYKDEVKKLWDDLDKSIADLQSNYDNQLASRTASIASSLGLWDEAKKNLPGVTQLTTNLQSQISVLESYKKSIAKLEERGVNEAFINELKSMGVDSAGEIQTIANMTDKSLERYVKLWEEKQSLAHDAAVEELEPLKAETEQKIQELTDATLTKYDELRAKWQEEAGKLAEETRQAMIDAENGMYDELIGEVETFTGAGADLMDGIVLGIVNQSPLLAEAVSTAVSGAIEAAKTEAGIASPSKVMKKEVGYNLADGVIVGWTDKIDAAKNKMAADMQGITARIKTAVTMENARMSQGVGVRDSGFTDIAQAVGMQTAGINSLASEFRHGSNTQITVPLVVDGRELGRTIIDLGKTETTRIGSTLVKA